MEDKTVDRNTIYIASLDKPLPKEWDWWNNKEDDIYNEIYKEYLLTDNIATDS